MRQGQRAATRGTPRVAGFRAIGAYFAGQSYHARGACASVASRLEIGSSGAVYFHKGKKFSGTIIV
ncbi:MAG: hypothetical protein AAB449_01965 [Patescibacteria group bacterium]